MNPADFDSLYRAHNDYRFRAPTDLTGAPASIGKGLVIGSCFADGLTLEFSIPGTPRPDYILYNAVGELPEITQEKARSYSYQLVALALRFVCPESLIIRLPALDEAAAKKFFEESCGRMLQMLHGTLRYNREYQLPAFVANFIVPPQNHLGRLFPRASYQNFVYVVEKLNEVLAQEIGALTSAYIIDHYCPVIRC